ncbi:excisionase family DNA-binding protein [Hoyosella altamirensis]|uniref:Excisionase family DNA binding protein n=1 Tax=Hoyosella altamirensis TaxID=616997 RepID=A0A839RUZ2_9ACTN|nr:excisionase family DNA-binding protein [Hoyosella altamirensis]MBB3040169.1 excisionase family DNA binding protein [Hoyosella altamirensis]
MKSHTLTRLAFSKNEAAEQIGVSLAAIDKLIADREIRTFTVGRRRLISAAALADFITAREAAEQGAA